MDFNSQSKLNWVIVGGCPRSGTTGLMNYLNNTGQVALIPEYGTERLMRTLSLLFYKQKNIMRKSWIGSINNSERKDTVNVGSFIKYVPQEETSKDPLLTTLYNTTFANSPHFLGEKFPRYWQQDLRFIASQVSSLTVIHIFRNPLKVFLSYKRRSELKQQDLDLWTYDNKFNAAVDLIFAFEGFFKTSKSGIPVVPVKYEDLQDTSSADVMRLKTLFSISGDESVLEPDFSSPTVEDLDSGELLFLRGLFAELEDQWHRPMDELLNIAAKINFRRRFVTCLLRRPSTQGLKAWLILSGVSCEKGFLVHISIKIKKILRNVGLIVFRVDA